MYEAHWDYGLPRDYSRPRDYGRRPRSNGTNVLFQTLLDYIEGGETLDELLRHFSGVTRETAIAALESAKESLPVRIA